MKLHALLFAGSAWLTLAGCGFQPLYAAKTGVAPALSAIAVETPGTRLGHLLREELEDELAVQAGAPPRYRLIIDLDSRRFPRGLRVDDTANRYEQRVVARYRLLDATTRQVLLTQQQPVSVTYSVADAPYAAVAAALDAEERAASEAARVIRTDLSRLFMPPAAPPPARTTGVR